MDTNESSSLFLFSDVSSKINLNILDNELTTEENDYEKRIKEFLNTWFIFGCRNECCKNYVSKEDIYLTKNNYNVVEHAFFQIFGDKYTNNILKYIVARLNRIRHIIKCEPDQRFESVFVDYRKKGKIYKKILSKRDSHFLLSKYKSIYNFYSLIHNKKNEDLMTLFDNIITGLSSNYVENNSFENKILPFIEENIFYNNSLYDDLREKALIISYEMICRFYESINVDVYSNICPTSQYVNGFFKIQTSVISNDVLYIFLRDSKNVLVYDFEDKLANDTNVESLQKIITIDKTRHIYLLTFETSITNLIYNNTNMIIFLSNGKVLINGNNTNNQIDGSTKEYYTKFINFNFNDITNISTIKIYENHIYLIDKKNNIYIYGNILNGDAFENFDLELVDTALFKDSDHIATNNFSLSPNEKQIIFVNNESLLKSISFDLFKININDNDTILTISDYNNENEDIVYDFSTLNKIISNIFILNGSAFIIELQEDENKTNVTYYLIGYDENNSYKYGYDEAADNLWDALKNLHSLSEIIQEEINSNRNEIDNKIKIKHVESFDDKTLILMSNGLIYGAGKNNGYFGHWNTYIEDMITYETLEEFKRINPFNTIKFDSFVTTKNTNKTLILAFNENYAIGYGSYYFLGMKNGSSFRFNNDEVLTKFNDNSLNNKTHQNFYSYFCTKNCIYYTNPFYDLISHFYISNTEYKNSSIDHVIKTLLYLKDISVDYNEEAYEHMVNNLTILSNDSDQPKFLTMNQTIVLFSNLQNYTMHDSMLLIYGRDSDKYNSVSKFINLIGLMSENFSAMKTKKTKIGNMSYDDFIKSLNDINIGSLVDMEERLNAFRNNNYRKTETW